MNDAPIGVYDSGLGGLTVWREVRRMLPSESLVYLGDGKNCPYGSRPREEVRRGPPPGGASRPSDPCAKAASSGSDVSSAARSTMRERPPEIRDDDKVPFYPQPPPSDGREREKNTPRCRTLRSLGMADRGCVFGVLSVWILQL